MGFSTSRVHQLQLECSCAEICQSAIKSQRSQYENIFHASHSFYNSVLLLYVNLSKFKRNIYSRSLHKPKLRALLSLLMMKSKHIEHRFSSLSLYSHTEWKDPIRLSGTIADAVRIATGVPLCRRVGTNTRPRRRRARVTGRPGRGAAPGAAGGRRHELILENVDPARTNHHTSDRTTPGTHTKG